MIRTLLICTLGFSAGIARDALAQHQTLAPQSQKLGAESALSLSGMVAGKPIQVSGGGTCGHAPDASMGGTSASLWTVQYRGSDDGTVKELNLRLLRPKDGGPDQLSFELKSKAGDHRIETGTGTKHKGEGTVTILPSGPGGRLELSGKDAKGKPIQLSIDCPTFGEVKAEGS
ncbi:MAG: hypothetical protein ACJ8A6_00675 [Gemmatimonadales bacterium]